MRKRPIVIIMLVAMMLFTLGQSALAFKDVKNDANEQKIAELKKLGILNGNAQDKFNPKGNLTYAEGVSLIVRGLGLNIDNIRFIRAPKASDYYPNVKDDAWYSDAFIIASLNGLEIPNGVKPNDIMTREQFAHPLFKGMTKNGDYAFIEIFMLLEDEAEVNKDYMDSIQKLMISKVVTLDKTNKFYPKKAITRSDAAGWLYDAIQFVKETPTIPNSPEQPTLDPKLTVTAVNADINKVTVTAQVPHPGYGLRIASIEFNGDQAIIHVEAVLPDPEKMYPQVITDVQVSTYVDAKLKAVLPATSGGSEASTGPAIIVE
jgi:hypothetical protein